MRKTPIDIDDFRQWVLNAEDEDLETFLGEIEDVVIDLESDDFFGTEGLNKRFC